MSSTKVENSQIIKSASVRNYKGIQHIDIQVSERTLFKIGGKNGHGKTSLLDALLTTLSGKKVSKMPVRKGEDCAEIKIELTDLTIKLKIDPDDPKIEPVIIDKESGQKVKSPKKALRALFGEATIDPSHFLRMKTVDKIAMLREVTVDEEGNPVDFTELDGEHERLYDSRATEKALLKNAERRLADSPPQIDAPAKEVSSAELISELDEANKCNAEIVRLAQVQESKSRESTSAERYRDEATKVVTAGEAAAKAILERAEVEGWELREGVKKRLGKAETALKDAERAENAAVAACDEYTDRVDTKEIEGKLANVETQNKLCRAQTAHLNARAERETQSDNLEEVERDLAQNKRDRADKLATSRFPVEDLTFDDNGIMYKGHPFDDASSAEQLEVAFMIAVSQRAKMPVVFIDNGELLDDESLEVFEKAAEKVGAQVFIAIGSRLEHYDLFVENGKAK